MGILTVPRLLFALSCRSALFWKTIAVALTTIMFIAVLIYGVCHCGTLEERNIEASAYALIAATSLCVNFIPVRRLKLTLSSHLHVGSMVATFPDKEAMRFIQDRRNLFAFGVDTISSLLVGLSTFLAAMRWLETEAPSNELRAFITILAIIAGLSLEITALARYTEEQERRRQEIADENNPKELTGPDMDNT